MRVFQGHMAEMHSPVEELPAEIVDIGRFYEFSHMRSSTYRGGVRFNMAGANALAPPHVMFVEVSREGAC